MRPMLRPCPRLMVFVPTPFPRTTTTTTTACTATAATTTFNSVYSVVDVANVSSISRVFLAVSRRSSCSVGVGGCVLGMRPLHRHCGATSVADSFRRYHFTSLFVWDGSGVMCFWLSRLARRYVGSRRVRWSKSPRAAETNERMREGDFLLHAPRGHNAPRGITAQ